MSAHLLHLAAPEFLAAPGFLDQVFGPDGRFKNAPRFCGPILANDRYIAGVPSMWIRMGAQHQANHLVCGPFLTEDAGCIWAYPLRVCYLDLRIPTVAARLAGLCSRVPFTEDDDGVTRITRGSLLKQAMIEVAHGAMRPGTASALAALTLSLAPKIAAQKVSP